MQKHNYQFVSRRIALYSIRIALIIKKYYSSKQFCIFFIKNFVQPNVDTTCKQL